MSSHKILITIAIAGFSATAGASVLQPVTLSEPINIADSISVCDSLLAVADSVGFEPVYEPLPAVMFLPAVYTGYDINIPSPAEAFTEQVEVTDAMPEWLLRSLRARKFANRLMQYHSINSPWQVPYNIRTMAAPPKKYVAKADPNSTVMIFEEIGATPPPVTVEKAPIEASEIKKQHWLNKFTPLVQFSQYFFSPNWYQGGNNSLNLLADFYYQSNLNTKFHPKLLFENSFQWRTALTSAPDDEYRAYSLTENRFQINSKFGYKAIYNWYYSITAVLKTPIFCGYKNGTTTRTNSFMSPGEFNVGVGMTYGVTTKDKKFNISLSISPLSYNLKTVIDEKIDETSHGLEEGHKGLNSIGSSLESNWTWNIAYNVSWKSRVFVFTDYERYQYDWQNQLSFNFNRFLSVNLFFDMRYDSTMKKRTYWYKTQMREQVTVGFSYTFSH